MKTTISLLLAIVFVLASPMPIFATTENNTSQLAPMVGILTLDDGTQVEIIGKLCSINTRTTTSNDTCFSITYQYDIPRPASNTRAGGESTIWDHDGGVASNVYLTLHCKHRLVRSWCILKSQLLNGYSTPMGFHLDELLNR